jgi:hypothetical protein
MKTFAITFKNKPVECCFFYFYNDRCSLLVDIIRHHRSISSRIFFAHDGRLYDYGRYCPLPTGDQPFEARDDGYLATTDLVNKAITGQLLKHDACPPLEFNIAYNDPQHRFSVTDPYEHLSADIFRLYHRPSLLNRLTHFFTPALNAEQLKGIISLYHEDCPILPDVNVKSLKFDGENLNTSGFKGSVVHHWGEAFPDYIFLMCNNFAGSGDSFLSLCLARANTPLAVDLVTGYLYMRHENREHRLSINNLSTTMYYSEGKTKSAGQDAPHYLTILAWRSENPNEKIKVKIDYDKTKAIPHILGAPCWTYFDVAAIVEYAGQTLSGERAILDVKGKSYELI